jgi:hypothetical protein
MNEEAQSSQKEEARRESSCPIRSLMESVCDVRTRHSGFFTHLLNAKIEFLKAMRSLLDEQRPFLHPKRPAPCGTVALPPGQGLPK